MATQKQVQEFIDRIAPLIKAEGEKRGYKIVSTVIAQAGVESAWGLSGLAKYHNYFGMKCGSKWKGKSVNMKTKEEYTVGTLTTIRDNFRAYDSMEEGVKGYYDFISTSRYANLKTATSPQQYAQMLKAAHFATSSTYVNTLVNTVNKYGLTKYDSDHPVNGNPYIEPTNLVKMGSRGNGVRWLQYQLNLFGYKLVVDGIAGVKTISALCDFQAKHNLKADGKCGELTRGELKKGG